MKKIILNVLKISLAAGLIFYLIRNNHIDVPGLVASLWGPQILVYVIINILLYVVMAKRLQLVLALNQVTCDYPNVLKFSFIGALFNFALPGSVSGDVVKGVYIAQHTQATKSRVLLSVLIDRLVALYTFAMGACFVAFAPGSLWVDSYYLDFFYMMMLWAFVGATLFVFVATRILSTRTVEKTTGILHQFIVGAQTFSQSPKQVFKILGLSLLGQGLYVYMFMLISDHLSHSHLVSYLQHFFIQCVGLIFTAIPISPAGIGVGQAVFHFLYGQILGMKSTLGATAISVTQVLNMLMGLIGAFYFVTTRKK